MPTTTPATERCSPWRSGGGTGPVWAVEGASGVGAQLAQRLVADGETVIDVPAKLSTRARMFDRGHGRKNDPADARTTAVVALRTRGLRTVELDDDLVAIRLMAERRSDPVRSRTATVNQLHQLLMELIPAGAERNLTAAKAKALLATVRPRDVAGRTRRQRLSGSGSTQQSHSRVVVRTPDA